MFEYVTLKTPEHCTNWIFKYLPGEPELFQYIIKEMVPLMSCKAEDHLLNMLDEYKDVIRYLPAYKRYSYEHLPPHKRCSYNYYDCILNEALMYKCYQFADRLIEYVDMKKCNEIGNGPIELLLVTYTKDNHHIITHGADINAQDNDGYNALHCAVCLYDTPIVQFLCEHGANINMIYRDNETIIDVARRLWRIDNFEYLCSLSGCLTKPAKH